MYYVLVDRQPVEVDLMTWARQTEVRHDGVDEDRDPWCVGQTQWEDGTWLSTVFLGLDHQWSPDGPPMLFETMLFGDDEEYQTRCSTWEEALVMHRIGVLEAIERHGQPIRSMLVGVL